MIKARNIFLVANFAAMLSACYVVPIGQYPNGAYGPGMGNQSGIGVVPMGAIRAPYTARLYPSNQAAAHLGSVSGVISNPEQGHGQFSFSVGGESFVGEATRTPNSAKGIANATGNHGGYVRCDYTMNSAELGTGTCRFSSGAQYDIHITQ